jgi:nucleotide-binding universal stress UspA family protein
MKRGFGIAPGPFLHAALPNRTCELAPHPALHKPRLAIMVLNLPMARAKGSSTPWAGNAGDYRTGVEQHEVEDLAAATARKLLADAADRLSRRCTTVERTGRVETEVIAAADGAELLVLARDGDCRHLGPHSLSHASHYIVDHAPCPVLLVWPGTPPPIRTQRPAPGHPPPPPR